MKMIEVFADKCPKSTLLNGPFGGDDRAFDRLLGPAGILTRTTLVTATMDGRVTYYGRTEAVAHAPITTSSTRRSIERKENFREVAGCISCWDIFHLSPPMSSCERPVILTVLLGIRLNEICFEEHIEISDLFWKKDLTETRSDQGRSSNSKSRAWTMHPKSQAV